MEYYRNQYIRNNKFIVQKPVNRGSLIYTLPLYPEPITEPEPLDAKIITAYEKLKETLDTIQINIDNLTIKHDEMVTSIDSAKKGGISYIVMKRMDDLKVIKNDLETEKEKYEQLEKDNKELKQIIDKYTKYIDMYNHLCELEEEFR